MTTCEFPESELLQKKNAEMWLNYHPHDNRSVFPRNKGLADLNLKPDFEKKHLVRKINGAIYFSS